jgi:hypothetical protein
MLVHPNSWNTRCIAQPELTAVLGEVADFPAIVAWVTDRRKLVWWPDYDLLLMLLLLWVIALELWWRVARLSCEWGVDHAVLRGSTARTASGGS